MKRNRVYTVFCFDDYGKIVKKYLRFCSYDDIMSDVNELIFGVNSIRKISLFVNSRTSDSSCGIKHVGSWRVPEWV